MTLDELHSSDKTFLNAAEIAPILGSDPHTIRLQARLAREMLGFPVIVLGRRVKIPRKPFLEYLGEGDKP